MQNPAVPTVFPTFPQNPAAYYYDYYFHIPKGFLCGGAHARAYMREGLRRGANLRKKIAKIKPPDSGAEDERQETGRV